MIIVQLKGGLGNQLFQYAAGLALAMHHKVELKVDISLLSDVNIVDTKREFELNQTHLIPIVATNKEISNAVKQSIFQRYLHKLLPNYKRKIYTEPDFIFDTNFFKCSNSVYLKGYRQSEKYFLPIQDFIKLHFFPKQENSFMNSRLIHELKNEETVGVHLRQGDYSNKEALEFHGILDADYYEKAISIIQSKIPNAKFYVFSDNIDRASKLLNKFSNFTLVNSALSKSAKSDFYYLCNCKHNIIANSSFSWWAAYLNPNPNKIVIAPKKWFNKAPCNTKDLYPEGWIKI